MMRKGQELAVIVPLEDLRLVRQLEDTIDVPKAVEAFRRIARDGAESWERVKRELGM